MERMRQRQRDREREDCREKKVEDTIKREEEGR